MSENNVGPDATCPDVQLLQRLMLGQLSDCEAGPLEEHLSRCARCDALADRLSAEDGLVAALRARSPVPAELPGTVLKSLIDRLHELLPLVAGAPGGDTPDSMSADALTAGNTPSADSTGLPHRPPTGDDDWLVAAERPEELISIGCYTLQKVLGRGGMGVVFQARQARPQRLVALKMILTAAAAGGERWSRFQSEIEAVARLQHANIVQVYEAGEHRGRP